MTSSVAVPAMLFADVAVIVAVPTLTPVATPVAALIVATAVLLLVQVNDVPVGLFDASFAAALKLIVRPVCTVPFAGDTVTLATGFCGVTGLRGLAVLRGVIGVVVAKSVELLLSSVLPPFARTVEEALVNVAVGAVSEQFAVLP